MLLPLQLTRGVFVVIDGAGTRGGTLNGAAAATSAAGGHHLRIIAPRVTGFPQAHLIMVLFYLS